MVCLSYFPFGIDSMMASGFPAFFSALSLELQIRRTVEQKKAKQKTFVAYL